MCCISDAQRHFQSVSHVCIGICIAYVQSSYYNPMELGVTYMFLSHHLPHPSSNWPLRRLVRRVYNKVNQRVYQLQRIRKHVSSDTACTIYKQFIVPLFDYCDFMVESSPATRYSRLENLQERAMKAIDNKANSGHALYAVYHVQPIKLRWREHICRMMYRQSKNVDKLDYVRPTIRLRSNRKVKFKKIPKWNYQLYLKSPMARGIKIWEMLTIEMQRATTKCKFKKMIKTLCRIK